MVLNKLYKFDALKCKVSGLLLNKKWTDCRFLVGTDPSNQVIIEGHKLILAMVSPVFEKMFYSEQFDLEDPIVIPDAQPDAFQAMLECIYFDEITIGSFERACQLCYLAKKYMLPHITAECILYLKDNLTSNNACQTYEFAKLLDEKSLMQSSMKLITEQTRRVLTDPSFKEIEITTLMDILNQQILDINSELDLFNAIIRFANERNELRYGVAVAIKQNENIERNTNNYRSSGFGYPSTSYNYDSDYPDDYLGACFSYSAPSDLEDKNSNTSVSDALENKKAAVSLPISNDLSNPSAGASSTINLSPPIDAQLETMLKKALKKIRFLTMTPKQFAEGPAKSKFLQLDEAFAILMNISSTSINFPMPDGFCTLRIQRNKPNRQSLHRWC